MTQESTSFQFETIQLLSDRLDKPVELNRIVTDIEIFENIERPYLTAKMLLVDDSNFYQEADIQGSERIYIKILSSDEEAIAVEKTFFINKVEKVEKIQDNAQVIAFSLVEDCVYFSNLLNLNRHYSGKISKIIQTIGKNVLKKEVEVLDTDNVEQQNINVIVPNMHPLPAMQWLTKRATTARGYPFYLYSTLIGDKLSYRDLGSLLAAPALNAGKDIKYVVSSTKVQDTMNVIQMRRNIENHSFTGQENLLDIIRKGMISSSFEFIDTLTEKTRTFGYDAKDDLFKKLITDEILSQDQPNPPINFNEIIESKKINEYSNNHTTRIGGSMAFRDSDGVTNPFKYVNYTNSYSESKSGAEYKNRIIRQSLQTMLTKNPLSINVNGIEFIKGDRHKTIGNNIYIMFMTSLAQGNGEASPDDKKKSGKYLIYSMRHMFKKSVDKYEVSATCVKIGSLKKEVV